MQSLTLLRFVLICLGTIGLMASPALQARDFIVVASTTSTENSGLFGHLLPAFEAQAGFSVRVISVGTGAALQYGRRCDADVVMVHAPVAEAEFVAAGHGVERHALMHNDFIIVGPHGDPAGLGDSAGAIEAMARIAEAGAVFVSRGDGSGTHLKELDLWAATGFDPATVSGTWYREAGAGMGQTLNIARAMRAYTLVDRGSWLSFGNRGELAVFVEADPLLFNPYGVIRVNERRCPNVKAAMAQQFIDWLLSDEGQRRIGEFRVQDQALFFPNRSQ